MVIQIKAFGINHAGARVNRHVHRYRYHIPFMPNGWDPAASFPAMAGNVPFLIKDVVLLAVSIYLLKQDLTRVFTSAKSDVQAQLAHV